MVTGSQWNQLPEKYEKWNSVYRFHLRWAHRNIFGELFKKHVARHGNDGRKVVDATHIKVHQDACHFASSPEKQGFGKTKGGRNSKLSAVTNGRGKALNFDLMEGNRADVTAAIRVLEDVTGQRRRGYYEVEDQRRHDDPENQLPMASDDPVDFIYRAGCTIIVDATTQEIRRIIRTKGNVTSDRELDRVRTFLRRGAGSAENAFDAGSLESVDDGFAVTSEEPFAMLHKSTNHQGHV